MKKNLTKIIFLLTITICSLSGITTNAKIKVDTKSYLYKGTIIVPNNTKTKKYYENSKTSNNNNNTNKQTRYKTDRIHKCEYYNKNYYDKNGKITDKITYIIQCEKNLHRCEYISEKYTIKNGNQTQTTTYSFYFGKNGNIVNKAIYQNECYKSK